MKIVVAPDSFKGSVCAVRAARAIARGVMSAAPDAEVVEVPIADGGEGTVEALVSATAGRFVEAGVLDPLNRPIAAQYGFLADGRTAVIEMAAASGLPLLGPAERNPLLASTFGTGQLILDAARRGAGEIIAGIGGSATVDGGTGMARALGIRFLDAGGRVLEGGGDILARIARIDVSRLTKELSGVRVTVACDVANPLTGPNGAAAVYGPQKGATPEMVQVLDGGLANLAACIRRDLGLDVELLEGAGAAGGLGAALVAFLGASLDRGVRIVLEAAGLRDKLRGASLVYSGEGRVDGQSACGKAVSGVAEIAKEARLPCVVIAGSVGPGAEALFALGVTALFSIARGPADESYMVANAEELIQYAATNITRTFVSGTTLEALGT